jgi:hypothetical protein
MCCRFVIALSQQDLGGRSPKKSRQLFAAFGLTLTAVGKYDILLGIVKVAQKLRESHVQVGCLNLENVFTDVDHGSQCPPASRKSV